MDLEAVRLAEDFFSYDPEVLPFVRCFLLEALERWPETEIFIQKSQASLRSPHPFCALYPPRKAKDRAAHALGLSVFLPYPVRSDRPAQAVEPYPGRWTNHLVLCSAEDLNAELWQ